MKTLNTLDTKRIKKKPEDYAVFVVFRTAQKALEIAFWFKRHRDVKEKFWKDKIHVWGGVISYKDGGYRLFGREGAPDSELLPEDIIQSVKTKLEEICKTTSITIKEPLSKKKK